MERIEPRNSKPAKRFPRRNGHHDDAKRIGAHYTGDVNGWDHGGYFYRIPEDLTDYIPFVEIGDPEWLPQRDSRDRFVDVGCLGCTGSWSVVVDLNRAYLAQVHDCEPSEITLRHVVNALLYGDDVKGAHKERDGAYLVRIESGTEDDANCRVVAKRWTHNQIMNAIAGWLA
jgi:hypothetical protein